MINGRKKNLLGVLVDAVDYQDVVYEVTAAAHAKQPFSVAALAVHGVMTGYIDEEHRMRLNDLDLVVPDGQPVRWALNVLYRSRLRERVYGPTLMLKICQAAEREGLSIYLYGSTNRVLARLQTSLHERFPGLEICGAEPSRFRCLSREERAELVDRIRGCGARVIFVGLGCPRQEVWAYEYRQALSIPILAVGAAFDFHAGVLKQAPEWLQRCGLEWLFRLMIEPRRLWRRYILLNPWYVGLVAFQFLGLRRFSPAGHRPPREVSYG